MPATSSELHSLPVNLGAQKMAIIASYTEEISGYSKRKIERLICAEIHADTEEIKRRLGMK